MERALTVCPIQSNQVRYSLLLREIERGTIAFCEENGIGIIVRSPLAKDLLTGRYTPTSTSAKDDERSGFPDFEGPLFAEHLAHARRLNPIAKSTGISLLQLAIAWTLRLPVVASTLVGAKTPSQIDEQLGVVGVTFTNEERERIARVLGP
jgi:aryl-alcohol dehydrogenase-like predicted oxidoreductase